jgi:hypothetical protein
MKVKVKKTWTIYDPDNFTQRQADFIGQECEVEEQTKGNHTVFLLKLNDGRSFPFMSKEFLLEHCDLIK